jgi:hypothetical protein
LSQTGAALIEYGVPDWGHQIGDFVFSAFPGGGEQCYVGFCDNSTGGSRSDQRVPRLGTGWGHNVLVFTQGALNRYILNGIVEVV